MQLTLSDKLTVNPDVVYTQIENDLVMMAPDDGYYSVNEIGTEIWSLLASQPSSLQAICDHIQTHYDVSEEQAIEDVSKFLDAMVEQNIIMKVS